MSCPVALLLEPSVSNEAQTLDLLFASPLLHHCSNQEICEIMKEGNCKLSFLFPVLLHWVVVFDKFNFLGGILHDHGKNI